MTLPQTQQAVLGGVTVSLSDPGGLAISLEPTGLRAPGCTYIEAMTSPRSQVDEILAELVDIYRRHRFDDLRLFGNPISAAQYRRMYHKVLKHARPPAEVLDWGCGAGHFSYGLARLGYRTSAYGFYDFPLRPLVQGEFDFTMGSLEDPVTIPYAEASFDAVVSVGVLEHVRETGGNERDSLGEVERILRPGGHFLCFHFPNRLSLIERLNRSLGGEHHHTYKYSGRDVRRLVEQAGLELEQIRRYGVLPRNVWNRLAGGRLGSWRLARAYGWTDDLLRLFLAPVAQNLMFVARKPVGSSGLRSGPEGPQTESEARS